MLLSGIQNLRQFRLAPERFLFEMQRRGLPFVERRMGSKRFVFIFSPELAGLILSHRALDYKKAPYLFAQMQPIIGRNALVRLEGEKWAKYRRLTNQFFGQEKMPSFQKSISAAAASFFDRWRHLEAPQMVDLEPVLTALVLTAAGRMLFGVDLGPFSEGLVQEFLALNSLCGEGIRSVVNLPHLVPTPRHLAQRRHYRTLREILRTALKENPPQWDAKENILAHFQSARGKGVDSERALDQMLGFLYPAFETTSTSLCWTALRLATEPKWQQTIVADRQRGKEIAIPDVRDFESDSPLVQFYLESLRLHPPAWILARENIATVAIHGKAFAPGHTFLISLNALHRDPKVWQSPECFEPGRFSPGHTSSRPPFAYIPFGAGPRICSGAKLGLTESVLILEALLDRFELGAASSELPEAELRITARPRGGATVWISPRRHSQSTVQ